ncbi:UDP-N-acetylmuramoyl-tripeptide--D-alanyl-D-alanine ligase [Nocardioides daejeonensis]|uniref:UDP-N-acetylmuramoyl-tripeptide--D-alanyl-D- alanine ligase n=1 Tax=Nocardioides daejeonensis TaxID=1046556 RepID=UPI001EF59C95|nr:UDP-N-acetylmuramoyl-tripeptide--D-alanyl-D-alanine ligase [Nocardioides daejeonensis]
MTLAEIADVVAGEVHGDPELVVRGAASLDSRAVPEDGLFVAIRGERVDGHDYAEQAVAGGAVAVLGARPTGVPTIVTADPALALAALARHVRDRLRATVVGITGSQGKTGTKDYLAQVFAAAGPTVATAGNFNNELGVPLTILRADADTSYLVVEMGARGSGHIAYLCGIARPRFGAVLNVGSAHASEFGTVDDTARAKGELLAALPADGAAVINADDRRTRVGLGGAVVERVLSFGSDRGTAEHGDGTPTEPADVTWWGETFDDLGRPRTTLRYGDRSAELALQQIGAHQIDNAAAAAALALAAGLDFEAVVAALNCATAQSRWRMEPLRRADGLVVLNDAYNANPESVALALDTLVHIKESSGRRTVAVLGVMRELGAEHATQHNRIGHIAARLGIDVIVVIGAEAAEIAAGAASVTSVSPIVVSTADRAAALAWLRENVDAHDVVLVKASRAAGLEVLAQELSEEAGA